MMRSSISALSLSGVRPPVLVVSLVASFLCAPIVFAQSAQTGFEGRSIVQIRFDPSDQPLPGAELERIILPLKTGAPLKSADVRAAIQKLYDTGRFADVSVDGEAASLDQVTILIHTE